MYQLLPPPAAEVLRLADKASIPPDPDNRDWTEYQAWLAEGNTPGPAEELPLRPVTKRQMLLWLFLNTGKSESDIIAALNTIAPAAAREVALIEFNYPDGAMRRDNPLFNQLAALFQMTPADVDAAFTEAAAL